MDRHVVPSRQCDGGMTVPHAFNMTGLLCTQADNSIAYGCRWVVGAFIFSFFLFLVQ